MNNEHYQEAVIEVNFNNIRLVLEEAKNLKSDIIIIPQLLFQSDIESSILGVSANSIVTFATLSNLDILRDNCPLWNDDSLKFISLFSKEISPFLKIIYDYAESLTRTQLSISDTKVKIPKNKILENLPRSAYIRYRKYIVNGEVQSVAYRLEVYDIHGVILQNLLGNNTSVASIINLINYDVNLFNIKRYRNLWMTGINVGTIDITNDIRFNTIMNSKTTDGAQIWIPDEEIYGSIYRPYILYLNKAFLNISKGDSVRLSIVDFVPEVPINYFLASFEITKPKKKCKLYVSFMAVKLNK